MVDEESRGQKQSKESSSESEMDDELREMVQGIVQQETHGDLQQTSMYHFRLA